MLRVAAKTPHCNDAYTCPTITWDTDMPDDAYVQGYTDIPAHVTAAATPPAGESIVRVPRARIIEAAHRFERERLFESFTDSVFRLETQPAYNVPADDPRWRAFLEGETLPERTPTTSPWLAQIAASTAAGRTWMRVHVLSQPLTDPMRFELTTDLENVAAGENVYVADRARHAWMQGLIQDFWGFDLDDPQRATVMLMRYDSDGRFMDAEISTDPDVIRRCRRRRDLVLPRSVLVADYLDQLGLEPAKMG
jgi:Family of unknown function (DUF6879)